ncbi:MAG: hypothetical protein ABR529_00315 [Actinomycetota bacterium]
MCGSGWCKWLVRTAFVIFAVGFVLVDPHGAAASVRITWDGVSGWMGDAADSIMTFVSALVEGG